MKGYMYRADLMHAFSLLILAVCETSDPQTFWHQEPMLL